MSSLISDDPKKPINAALIFFALVGFIASVVTVVQFLRPQDQSALEVDIFPHEFRTPHYSSEPLQSGKDAREMISDMRSAFCKEVDEQLVLDTGRAELRAMEEKSEDSKGLISCKDFTEIEFAARWAGEYSESDGEMLRYEIRNVGTKVANDIRLKADKLNSLQYKRGNEYVEVEKTENNEYYDLPSLNPSEDLTVLTWTTTFPKDPRFYDWDDFPRVTFAGSEVKTELYKPVTDGWYNLYDFFDDAPIVLSAAFVLLGSILVVLAAWLAIAIPTALITGKPLNEVFNDKEKAGKVEEESEAD